MPNAKVEQNALARKLKQLYEIFRRQSSPGYNCGSRFDDEWFKLAKLVNSIEADPVIYLEAQFECWDGVPFPSQLCSPRSRSIHQKYLEKGKTIGQLEFENQIKCLMDCVNFYKKKYGEMDAILMLDFVPVKAYIRVLLCGESYLPEVLKKYGSLAKAEIKFSPSVDKHLKENYVSRYSRLFPQRFSEIADSESDSLPEPSSTNSVRKNYPRRRRLTDT